MNSRNIMKAFTREMLWNAEFGIIDSYLDTMESFLEQVDEHARIRDADFRSRYLDNESTIDDDSGEENEPSDLTASWMRGFTSSLRSSFFVSLYSFLESSLANECRNLGSERTALLLNDISGRSFLDRVNTYYTKILGASFPDATPEWKEINDYRLLRNCIVHNRGFLTENSDLKLRNFIGRKSSLRLVEDEFYFEKEFCREV